MFPTRLLSFVSLLAFSSAGFAQTANTVFGAGYSFPVPINAAPGQILNLFVQGIGANLTQKVGATSLPLPVVLAGISVQLRQGPQSTAVPLFAVRPISTCLNGAVASGSTCGQYTAVTVQIPYELVPNCQWGIQPCPLIPSYVAQLIVSENGVPGGAVNLNPVADEVHVSNLCDIDTSGSPACATTPAVTHADGTLVSMASPAKGGEEIVLWVLGLGATKPTVPTGQASPQPAPVTLETFQLNFDYRPNAPPYRPVCATAGACLEGQPVFSGLTPGYAGLYQVNFIVPPPPAGTPACDGSTITSNLTVSLLGLTSLDGARICVDGP